MSMIWSSRERNRSCSPPSRRSRGRIANLPLHQFEREESRLAIRGNPQNPICKKIALQRSKTGKFDYFRTPNQPARSRDSEFFTDDKFGAFPTSSFSESIPHRMVAFGAKQTCIDVRLRPPQSRQTQSRHKPDRTITFKSPGSTPPG